MILMGHAKYHNGDPKNIYWDVREFFESTENGLSIVDLCIVIIVKAITINLHNRKVIINK